MIASWRAVRRGERALYVTDAHRMKGERAKVRADKESWGSGENYERKARFDGSVLGRFLFLSVSCFLQRSLARCATSHG